eukprot:m.659622 g.659622  ORF g.659622 m.659622 type:complete len:122 (-) comp58443_c0_seq67:777-1142(-)
MRYRKRLSNLVSSSFGSWLCLEEFSILFKSLSSFSIRCSLLFQVSGLPWWSTICLATIGLRCVTVPFVTLLLKHNSKAKIAKARLGYLLERFVEQKMTCWIFFCPRADLTVFDPDAFIERD